MGDGRRKQTRVVQCRIEMYKVLMRHRKGLSHSLEGTLTAFIVNLLVTMEVIPQVSRCFTGGKDRIYNVCILREQESTRMAAEPHGRPCVWSVPSFLTPEPHISTMLFGRRHAQGTAMGGVFGRRAASPP